jgi:ATP-dependent Clp protease ATP-binding subunit ClpA
MQSPMKDTIRPSGLRPLKRIIQRKLQNPLATTELLKGHFPEGFRLLRVELEEGEFVFQPLDVVASK